MEFGTFAKKFFRQLVNNGSIDNIAERVEVRIVDANLSMNRLKLVEFHERADSSEVLILVVQGNGDAALDVDAFKVFASVGRVVQNLEVRVAKHTLIKVFRRGSRIKQKPRRRYQFDGLADLVSRLHELIVDG